MKACAIFGGLLALLAALPCRAQPPARGHWAWTAPRRPALPAVKDAAWCRSPIDRFILARLEAAGVSPAGPARPEALLRRVTFDLIGLPPRPVETAAFAADYSAK